MKRSLVRSSRVYELYCEAHGVLESNKNYALVKEARRRHRQESPACFNTESWMEGGKG